jgi:CheY-like chemotaxis protein
MKRILVADDNEVNLRLIKEYLEFAGFDVTAAGGGADCLRELGKGGYDCLILDVQMPEVDGLAVLRELRGNAAREIRSIPVLALTALAYPRDREKCERAGASLYLAKPVPFREVVAHLRALIDDHELNAASGVLD